MPRYACRASSRGSPATTVEAGADTVRSGSAVDWLPGAPEAHPASPAAQHDRTATRKIRLLPRNPGHLPPLAESGGDYRDSTPADSTSKCHPSHLAVRSPAQRCDFAAKLAILQVLGHKPIKMKLHCSTYVAEFVLANF